jgi:hypothetical protein
VAGVSLVGTGLAPLTLNETTRGISGGSGAAAAGVPASVAAASPAPSAPLSSAFGPAPSAAPMAPASVPAPLTSQQSIDDVGAGGAVGGEEVFTDAVESVAGGGAGAPAPGQGFAAAPVPTPAPLAPAAAAEVKTPPAAADVKVSSSAAAGGPAPGASGTAPSDPSHTGAPGGPSAEGGAPALVEGHSPITALQSIADLKEGKIYPVRVCGLRRLGRSREARLIGFAFPPPVMSSARRA